MFIFTISLLDASDSFSFFKQNVAVINNVKWRFCTLGLGGTAPNIGQAPVLRRFDGEGVSAFI